MASNANPAAVDYNEEIPEVVTGPYATEDIGTPDIPGNSYASGNFGAGLPVAPTGTVTERVRGWLFTHVYETWMPYTSRIINRFMPPRKATVYFESQYDLDAGERETRQGPFPLPQRPFPYPYAIGDVSGFMPMLDAYSLAWAWAKTPSGPGVSTPIPVPWDAQYPGMPKVSG